MGVAIRPLSRADVTRMAHILSVLLALSPTIIGGQDGIKHVMEGEEYLINSQISRDPKAARSLCTEVPEDKFKSCHQSKGDNRSFYDYSSEIFSVLKHVRPGDDFVPNFEMFAKSDVNGKNENPIYTFLKSRCPSVRKEFQAPYKLYYDPYHQDDIRWNFEKFLIDHRGQPVRRYDESLDPLEIVPDIDVLLDNIDSTNGVETETTPRNIDA